MRLTFLANKAAGRRKKLQDKRLDEVKGQAAVEKNVIEVQTNQVLKSLSRVRSDAELVGSARRFSVDVVDQKEGEISAKNYTIGTI